MPKDVMQQSLQLIKQRELEAQLKSTEEERGRLVESVRARVES